MTPGLREIPNEGLPPELAKATADQVAARVALAGALTSPAHAYVFAGAAGVGKAAAARAFAAELLAEGAADPSSARRRALADPSPHPDLTWVKPPGMHHLVDEIRSRVIAAAAYGAFEGQRRVFVIERAEAMEEESQNALLKTLEEPAAGAHLILISSQLDVLLETVRSRCIVVRFASLSPASIEERLRAGLDAAGADASGAVIPAVAGLCGGDLDRARFLLSAPGLELRSASERLIRACRDSRLSPPPWSDLIAVCRVAGEQAGAAARARIEQLGADGGSTDRRTTRRLEREAEDAQKRASRHGRTEALDLGLALIATWCRDLAIVADAPASALARDRMEELAADAEGLDPRRARRAGELVMETRRRLRVNLSEELTLEALAFRLEALLRRA